MLGAADEEDVAVQHGRVGARILVAGEGREGAGLVVPLGRIDHLMPYLPTEVVVDAEVDVPGGLAGEERLGSCVVGIEAFGA